MANERTPVDQAGRYAKGHATEHVREVLADDETDFALWFLIRQAYLAGWRAHKKADKENGK